MRFAIVGSGAVGGYYGAQLARAGHDVTFLARGAHLAAIRERGLHVRRPMLGDYTVHAPAEEDPSRVGHADVVLLAVKAYDNEQALPGVPLMLGPDSSVLTLQNGVDSASELARLVPDVDQRVRVTLVRTPAERVVRPRGGGAARPASGGAGEAAPGGGFFRFD
jgi:2-dehydropantoate 2-reductase